MDINAKITDIKYTPLLCRNLKIYTFKELEKALSTDTTFLLELDKANRFAVSWWVSAKRTRSYPYVRVYDSLAFTGKKITIIPVVKDEGLDGDRDFIQWDTVSLMSLFGIFTIIGYYRDAEASARYENKITKQVYNIEPIKSDINKLLSYHSSALDWNISQISNVGVLGQKAIESYLAISKKLGIKMHSELSARRRVIELLKSKEEFMGFSRNLAAKAQERESETIQPKEYLLGRKATLTILNNFGGYYYFTADEAKIDGNNILLTEGKHSKTNSLPSLLDIKDGLFKMALFTNLKEVQANGKKYNPIPILKLTTINGFNEKNISESQHEILDTLRKESKDNGFQLLLL